MKQLSREEPKSRCMECGSVYEMKYVGPQDDGHGHGHDDHHPGKLRTCTWSRVID
jgi:cytochrome c oxidase subunit 5b